MVKQFSLLLFILGVFVTTNVMAQAPHQIGFVNSTEILDAMPEKKDAEAKLDALNEGYKSELALMQNEYNKKYTDFMSYQVSMAENVRLRRMQELYEMERKINDFMKVAEQDIRSQEEALLNPIRTKLKNAIYEVGVDMNLLCVYDLANPTIAFVTPNGVNVAPLVRVKLGVKE